MRATAAIAPCAVYALDDAAYSYCVRREALGELDLEQAGRVCDHADPAVGEGSAGCRQLWVYDRLRAHTTLPSPDLLDFCRSDDCRFDVVETRARPTFAEQAEECKAVGEDEQECVGHAAQRWFWQRPTVEEILAFQQAPTEWPTVVGTITGAALACAGSEAPCAGEPEVVRGCVAGRQVIARGMFTCSSPPFYLPDVR